MDQFQRSIYDVDLNPLMDVDKPLTQSLPAVTVQPLSEQDMEDVKVHGRILSPNEREAHIQLTNLPRGFGGPSTIKIPLTVGVERRPLLNCKVVEREGDPAIERLIRDWAGVGRPLADCSMRMLLVDTSKRLDEGDAPAPIIQSQYRRWTTEHQLDVLIATHPTHRLDGCYPVSVG